MPTYDYQCDACDHVFEEWQSFKDEPLTKCPKCKKKKLRRLLGGGAAIIFKGSGFYETDYRSESYKSAEKADKEVATAKTESTSETRSEVKSESTSKPEKTTASSSKSSGKKSDK